jgi:hypothetical protein
MGYFGLPVSSEVGNGKFNIDYWKFFPFRPKEYLFFREHPTADDLTDRAF